MAATEPVAPGDGEARATGVELETDGACGWSKSETCLELLCGGQKEVRTSLSSHHSPVRLFVFTSLTCLCLQAPLYMVDPLSWCPHLDAVKPVPPSGIDVFQSCQDCGSGAENWTCLTCYQVTRRTSPSQPLSPLLMCCVSSLVLPVSGVLWSLCK